MITYLYWVIIICVALASLIVVGGKLQEWKSAIVASLVVLAVGYGAYYFHFQQVFVKHWGGVMTIKVPSGQHHMGTTWKDDHLWIENYDPESNSCIFTEYSKGHVLQGRVTIKNCNPLMPR